MENLMPVLKSLSFSALPKTATDPVQQRRTKFITKLEEQKLLVKDPNHVRSVQRWTKSTESVRPLPSSRRYLLLSDSCVSLIAVPTVWFDP
jgi:valyl-tRNA synthetase